MLKYKPFIWSTKCSPASLPPGPPQPPEPPEPPGPLSSKTAIYKVAPETPEPPGPVSSKTAIYKIAPEPPKPPGSPGVRAHTSFRSAIDPR